MEVGIEDCLHIEFEYDKQKYHLKVRILSSPQVKIIRVTVVSFTGRYPGQNILPFGANKDQAHGTCCHQERSRWRRQ